VSGRVVKTEMDWVEFATANRISAPKTLSDPVFLHGGHLFGPSRKGVAVDQKVFGVIGDAEKPLPEFLLTNNFAAAPAGAGFHLFVGQNRLTVVAPVDKGFLPIDHILFEHFQKKPLLPSIILGPAGGDFPIPVIGKSHSFELTAHIIDVFIGPSGRMGVVGNRGILRRHAEGVPTHGMQHVKSVHSLIAGHHVADGVVADVAHVNFARRIRKHLQYVVFFLFRVFSYPEQAFFIPDSLPLGLNHFRIVSFLHRFSPPGAVDGKTNALLQ